VSSNVNALIVFNLQAHTRLMTHTSPAVRHVYLPSEHPELLVQFPLIHVQNTHTWSSAGGHHYISVGSFALRAGDECV